LVSGDAPVDSAERAFSGDTAACYARYRREYPAELILRLRQFSRAGDGRLLDLGCGTGQLLLQLAGHFAEAVGIDSEPDMLSEAVRVARNRDVGNAEWINASSGDLPRLESELGRFDLVTIGTAFHFMEPRATLRTLKRMLTSGGGVVVACNGSQMWLHLDPWAKALRSFLESRFGPLRDLDVAVEAVRVCEATMRDLGFRDVERWERTYQSTIDIDFIVGHIFSATSPAQIPPEQRPAFEEHLRAAIAAAAPFGNMTETVVVRAVIGRTKPRGTEVST
jgi:ubiquinone/menaquinone biosynthesis C-methylase UbiE